MLATFMDLKVHVEHRMDVGFAVFEDEPSFFHAQNARTSAEGLHRRDGVALPLDVNEYQWPNVFDRETDATGMVCDMHVLDETRSTVARSRFYSRSSIHMYLLPFSFTGRSRSTGLRCLRRFACGCYAAVSARGRLHVFPINHHIDLICNSKKANITIFYQI